MKALDKYFEQYYKIYEQAEAVLLKEIEKLCNRYGWRFSSVGFGYSVETRDGKEIESKRIDKMLEDFGDHFGNIGFYVFENGEWIEGQTPLIAFEKPRFVNQGQ